MAKDEKYYGAVPKRTQTIFNLIRETRNITSDSDLNFVSSDGEHSESKNDEERNTAMLTCQNNVIDRLHSILENSRRIDTDFCQPSIAKNTRQTNDDGNSHKTRVVDIESCRTPANRNSRLANFIRDKVLPSILKKSHQSMIGGDNSQLSNSCQTKVTRDNRYSSVAKDKNHSSVARDKNHSSFDRDGRKTSFDRDHRHLANKIKDKPQTNTVVKDGQQSNTARIIQKPWLTKKARSNSIVREPRQPIQTRQKRQPSVLSDNQPATTIRKTRPTSVVRAPNTVRNNCQTSIVGDNQLSSTVARRNRSISVVRNVRQHRNNSQTSVTSENRQSGQIKNVRTTRKTCPNEVIQNGKPKTAKSSKIDNDGDSSNGSKDQQSCEPFNKYANRTGKLNLAYVNRCNEFPYEEAIVMIEKVRHFYDIPACYKNEYYFVKQQKLVCVRKRPVTAKEIQRKEMDIISVPSMDTIVVHEPRYKVDLTRFLDSHQFKFDFVFDENCDNKTVFNYTARPLIRTVFEGGTATVFAYGQTGSGKTHTMGGTFDGRRIDSKCGIYGLSAEAFFQAVYQPRYRKLFDVSVSYFEIYGEKVYDLLANRKVLRVMEDANHVIHVVGKSEKAVKSEHPVLAWLKIGHKARTSGHTAANEYSSRSHAVFQLRLRKRCDNSLHGEISLIDLAGNESLKEMSNPSHERRIESADINTSLLALKECVRAMGKDATHIPFRTSKLTQVLRDCFVDPDSKVCMIAMVSPLWSACDFSLNTLRYANRVKELEVLSKGEGKAKKK